MATATVIAGVVLAHVVAYLSAYPGGGERAAHLRATGHGYWPVAVFVAVAAGVVAVAAAAVAGRRHRNPATGVVASAARLAALQLAAFTTVEVVERVAAGLSPAELLHSPEFVVGAVLQVAVAAVAVLLLRGVATIAARAGRARRRARAMPARWSAAGPEPVVSDWWRHRGRPRAPPCRV